MAEVTHTRLNTNNTLLYYMRKYIVKFHQLSKSYTFICFKLN